MTPAQALQRLLAGTGFVAIRVGPNAFRIVRAPVQHAPPETASEPAPESVDDTPIIVTAGKEPQLLETLPLDVSVVHFPPIAKGTEPRDSAGVADSVEGLTLTGLGPGRNRLFLRGVADSSFTGTTQSTVAVLLNDSRVTYAAPDPDLQLIDVERVEVIKGPQGSLYGSGTLGGIYHIVTRQPDLGTFDGSVTAGVIAVGAGDIEYLTNAVANLVLLPNQLGLRVVAYQEKTPGWIDTGTITDSNVAHTLGGRASLLWQVNSAWSASLLAQLQRLSSDDSQYVYAPETLHRPAQYAEPHDNDFSHIALKLAGPIGAIQVQLITGMTWQDIDTTVDATIGADQLGVANPSIFTDDRRYRVWDNEARFGSETYGVTWLVGLSHIEASIQSNENLASATLGVPPLLIQTGRRVSTETSLFGNATVPLSPTISAVAGVRLFHGSSADKVGHEGGTIDSLANRIGATPSLALSWHPEEGRLVYLRYGSAHRPAGLDLLQSESRTALKGDELSTVETGMRQDIAKGGFEVSAYGTWWNNVQSDTLLPNGLFQTRNAGRAQILGAEASLNMDLGAVGQLKLGAATQKALLVMNSLGIVLDDRRLPTVPDYTLRASVDHNVHVGAAHGSIGLQLRFVGPSRLSFDPGLDRKMGSALESGLNASLDYGDWTFVAQAGNLTDSRANVFAYGNQFRLRTLDQFTPQRPINLELSVGKRF
jgi:outer membrane receptor protein involved in Fe transport